MLLHDHMDWDRKAGTILTVRHLSTVEQAKHERKEKKINLTEEKKLRLPEVL